MSLIGRLHGNLVFGRRVAVLSRHLAEMLPPGSNVLDIGAGSGTMARQIAQRRPGVTISGIDVLVRPQTEIPVTQFDGKTIPYPDKSFDVAMFVDVLHHTEDPLVLLREAARVARRAILLKDHTREGWLAGETLRLMDYAGNAQHGVALPYNYWTKREWDEAIGALGAGVGEWRGSLGLYPPPASWLFDRSLHFIARLDLEKG